MRSPMQIGSPRDNDRFLFRAFLFFMVMVFGILIATKCRPTPDEVCVARCRLEGARYDGTYQYKNFWMVECDCTFLAKKRRLLRP